MATHECMIDGSLLLHFTRSQFLGMQSNCAFSFATFSILATDIFLNSFGLSISRRWYWIVVEHTYIYDDRHNYMNHKFKRIFTNKKKEDDDEDEMCINYENTHWNFCMGFRKEHAAFFFLSWFFYSEFLLATNRRCQSHGIAINKLKLNNPRASRWFQADI